MSLLDDVSIVVTPNGYKAGTLYGVLPTATEGSDLVTNGGFDTDSDWNGSGSNGWTISGGKASNDGTSGSNNLSQSGILEVDKRYKIDITVSNYVSGNVEVSAGASPRGRMTANGTYTFYQTCTPSTAFYIIANSFDGSIDNVSVKEWTSSDMDVTRETAATRVDENGLVNYAEVLGDELITNGDFTQTPLGTGWTVINDDANNYVVFDGSTARLKFPNTSPLTVLSSGLTLTAGKTYKLIVDVLTATSGGVKIEPGGGISETFDSAGLTTRILQPTANVSVSFYRATPNVDITFNSVSVKEVDLNNVPRIDYTGGGCPHILSEPQRTNLVTYSEDFSQSYWTKQEVLITSNATSSPSGDVNASKIIPTSVSSTHQLSKTSLISSQVCTMSVYAKEGGLSTFNFLDGDNGYHGSIFDLSDGTFTNQGTGVGSIENMGNGWYRCIVTVETTGYRLYIPNSSSTYTGNDVDGIYIFGASFEVGSYATSYIPTSGSTVTRNQDQFTRDGISSLINSTEGVLFAEMSALANDGTFRIISLSDGTGSNRLWLYFTVGSNLIQVFDGTTIMAHTIDVTNMIKVAAVFDSNGTRMWVNGSQVGSNSYVGFSGFDRLNFSSESGSNNFFGKIKQVQVYDTALTDNQLIQLTGEAGTHFFESYSEMAETLTYTIQ